MNPTEAALVAKGWTKNAKGDYDPPTRRPAPQAASAVQHGPPSGSVLERTFVGLWTARGGPTLEREVPLIPGRMFRVDFLHRETKTVIEVEGYGLGHTSKKSFAKDGDKYFMLQIGLGYEVVRLTSKLITDENVQALIRYVSRKPIVTFN